MSAMLCVSMVRNGAIPAGTDEACAEAGGNLLLIGSGLDQVDLATDIPSAGWATLVSTEETRARLLAPMIIGLLDQDPPTAIVLPSSPDGRDLAPHLAHLLDRPLFAGAVSVRRDRVTTTRTAGRIGDDFAPGEPFVATLIPGTRGLGLEDRKMSERPKANVVCTRIDLDATSSTAELAVDGAVQTVEVLPSDPATMDLTEAKRIVGGGQGLHTTERFTQLGLIGAALGGTRVASDAGWIPFERQIGTTGVIVKPSLYLAFAISGATQHTSGLGDPDHVISVNTDASCPMMTMADVAIVADANEVLDALAKKLNITVDGAVNGAANTAAKDAVA
jgi:electron transfer flavoprotein alpha subunit